MAPSLSKRFDDSGIPVLICPVSEDGTWTVRKTEMRGGGGRGLLG